MIAIIDYDTGNLRSVCNALDRIGAEYVLTDDPKVIAQADRVLLPGVGEASSAMAKLQERGLCDVIRSLKVPVLGICIGMQLMCRHSEEGDVDCLGIFDSNVRKFEPDPAAGVKVDEEYTALQQELNALPKFDYEKGKWFNHEYIMKKDNAELAELFMPILKANGIEAPMDKVVTVVGLMKDRVSFVKDLWETCKFFFVAPTEYDEKTCKKRWKADSPAHMLELADFLEAMEDFSVENQEKEVMAWIAEKGYHLGNVMNAFRLTLVGEGKGPHIFDITAVLGKEESLRRIRRAVEVLK